MTVATLPNWALQSDGRVGRFAPSRVRRGTPVSLACKRGEW